MWKCAKIGCTIDMKIGWALDMIGWACAQPFRTLTTPLSENYIITYIMKVTLQCLLLGVLLCNSNINLMCVSAFKMHGLSLIICTFSVGLRV